MPSSTTGRLLIALLAVAGGIVAVVSLRSQLGKSAPRTMYTVSSVQRGDIVRSIDTTGQLTPLVSVEVSTQISGLVKEVNVDFNSGVKRGGVLARLDSSTYEQNLRQARADLSAAAAGARLARLKIERLRDLRSNDLVTQAEFDEAQAQWEQAAAIHQTHQAAVENAEVDLERCTIVSPIDGLVIYKQIEVGKTIQASFSAPTLFVIARDLKTMQIVAPVSEIDINSVQPGQEIVFTVDAVEGRTFRGHVVQTRSPYTSPGKEQPQSQSSGIPTFDVVVEVDNKELLLRPSLTANVSIITSHRRNVLLIPNSALRVQLSQNIEADSSTPAKPYAGLATVYRLPTGVRSSTPARAEIRVGIADSQNTEVLQGLEIGETVVTGKVVAADPIAPSPGFF